MPGGFYPRNQRAHKYIPKILAIRFENAGVAHAETIVGSLLCCGVGSSVSFKSFVLRHLVIATTPKNCTAYKTAKEIMQFRMKRRVLWGKTCIAKEPDHKFGV